MSYEWYYIFMDHCMLLVYPITVGGVPYLTILTDHSSSTVTRHIRGKYVLVCAY